MRLRWYETLGLGRATRHHNVSLAMICLVACSATLVSFHTFRSHMTLEDEVGYSKEACMDEKMCVYWCCLTLWSCVRLCAGVRVLWWVTLCMLNLFLSWFKRTTTSVIMLLRQCGQMNLKDLRAQPKKCRHTQEIVLCSSMSLTFLC